MTPSSAIQFAKLIEKYKPMWFEEPIPPSNFDSMGFVAKNCSIPIATGERLSTKYEFNKILQINGANIIQMNLGRVGGILEAKKLQLLLKFILQQLHLIYIVDLLLVPQIFKYQLVVQIF